MKVNIESDVAMVKNCHYPDVHINDILNGNDLTEESFKKLTRSPCQIQCNIVKMLETFMPKPVERLYTMEIYQSSVYKVIPPDAPEFINAIKQYRLKLVHMSLYEYLMLVDSLPIMNLIFRSSSTRIYLSIDESLKILKDWIRFQFGVDGDKFVNDIWMWLTKVIQKRGGFLLNITYKLCA